MTRSLARGSRRLSSGLTMSESEAEYGDVVDTAGSGPGATRRQAASRRCGAHCSICDMSGLQRPCAASQRSLLYGAPPAVLEGCLQLCACLSFPAEDYKQLRFRQSRRSL